MAIASIVKNLIPKTLIQQSLDNKECILFTFDDGPHPEITPKVLDILDKFNVKSVFCIPSSRIVKAPHLLDEIVARGHSIQNHGRNHLNCSELSISQIKDEIQQCQSDIFEKVGLKTSFFRPPYGITTLSTVWASKRMNHSILRWSFDVGEYSYMQGSSSQELADNVIRKISGGDIILAHDDNAQIPEVLAIVLPKLKSMGFDLSGGLTSLIK